MVPSGTYNIIQCPLLNNFVSISALQWLCNADKKEHHVPRRLFKFFSSLYACLVSYQRLYLVSHYLKMNRPEVPELCYNFTQKTQHK